jgi:hypothetical protein
VKAGNGRLIADSIKKTNSKFILFFGIQLQVQNLEIQGANSCEPFAISTKLVRRRLAVIGKNKSVGPDSVSGKILELGGEAMIPYFVRLFD